MWTIDSGSVREVLFYGIIYFQLCDIFQESLYLNVLFPWQQMTNSTSQLSQNILHNTALSGLPIAVTQQSQQPATAQLQSSTTKETMQQQLFSTASQIVPRITGLTAEQMCQQQAATAQTTMEQEKQMHITGPKNFPTSQVPLHTEPRVKLENEKELLTRNLSLPQVTLDGQGQQSDGSSNTIDPTANALAILADSSVQYHHSFSRLLRSSTYTSTAAITTSTTSPIISTTNVPSGTKHVQPSVLFTSGLASISGTNESQYTVPPIANIMSSLKSAAATTGKPPRTATSPNSLNLPACIAETTTSSHHISSSENTVTLASRKCIPPQVLGIQQIAAQIIQEAKKQERKVTE